MACCKISKLVDMNLKTEIANRADGNAEIIQENLSYVFAIVIAIASENKECVFATNLLRSVFLEKEPSQFFNSYYHLEVRLAFKAN